jgi:hypothetical protein
MEDTRSLAITSRMTWISEVETQGLMNRKQRNSLLVVSFSPCFQNSVFEGSRLSSRKKALFYNFLQAFTAISPLLASDASD